MGFLPRLNSDCLIQPKALLRCDFDLRMPLMFSVPENRISYIFVSLVSMCVFPRKTGTNPSYREIY